MEVDPDYAGLAAVPRENSEEEKRCRILEENAREATVSKIRMIINEQFDKEIQLKENELMRINQKLADARCVMDRLRACVVASFYAASFTKPVDGAKGPEAGAAYHPAIQNVMRKAVTAVMSKNAPHKQQTQRADITESQNEKNATEADDITAMSDSVVNETQNQNVSALDQTNDLQELEMKENAVPEAGKSHKEHQNLGGRQRIKKTVIVGNVSKYIPSEQRESSDKSTHKWMVYVRGSKQEPRIDHFVRKVWFFLHPSYRPNDLVEVCEAPFHLTRRGWGEFPIRVQIHFCDRRNKPVDIIHGLRLDRTYTGLQTLGAETVCEVELDRSSVQFTVDDILEVSNLPCLTPDSDPCSGQEEKNDCQIEKEEEHMEEKPLEDTPDTQKDAQDQEPIGENMIVDETKSDKEEPQQSSSSCSASSGTQPRKRQLAEGSNDNNEGKLAECEGEDVMNREDLTDEPTPHKRKRKRRRDSCKTSTSEDESLPDSLPNEMRSGEETDSTQDGKESDEKAPISESVTISRVVGDPSHNEDVGGANSDNITDGSEGDVGESDEKKSIPSSSEGIANDSQLSSGSSDLSANIKQPVVILPRSPISGMGIFRMRSASDGEGIPNRSCSKLLKTGVSVSPVINVSLNQDPPRTTSSSEAAASENSPRRKVTVLSPRNVILQSKGTSSQPIVLSTISAPAAKKCEQNQEESKPVIVIKKESAETSRHITIPLSSLLKTGASQPQVLKLSQPPSQSGQTFSVNMSTLTDSGAVLKPRQKRSLSADHSPLHTLSVTPMVPASTSSTQQPIQLHILSSQHPKSASPKKSKTVVQSAVTLQTLQAALSSGSITLGRPQPKKPEGLHAQVASTEPSSTSSQQYVLATVVNPKGKQHLALINPSTLALGGSKRLITIMGSKGKKATGSVIKQPPTQKPAVSKVTKSTEIRRPSQQDNPPPQPNPEPLYKVLGDKVNLRGKVLSIEEDVLHHVVRLVPLIDDKKEVSHFPFCAKTEADFLDWNIGKQRASEWQRACLVQKVLKYMQDKHEDLRNFPLPSKKFIMNWCLRHGYSVFTDEYEDEIEETDEKGAALGDLPQTMSSTEEILKVLEEKKTEQSKRKKLVEADDDVVFIDVVNIDPPAEKVEDVKQEPSDIVSGENPDKTVIDKEKGAKIQSLIESPQVSAIEEMTREIGITLHRTYGMPACHLVLAKALEQFTESLIRKSLSCALKKRDGVSVHRVVPDGIEVSDVFSAICDTATFDFLTDGHTACQSSS